MPTADTRPASRTRADRRIVGGVAVSHPNRLIFPELGISKLDFARYFEAIGDWIVPHVRARPLTLLHCPAGVAGTCMFLRHAKAWGPNTLRRVNIREKTKVGEYLVADSIAGVIALAQMGIVEIHTWNSTAEDVERPNRIVWDLDPGAAVRWADTVSAARTLRSLLQTVGLESWVKTTGGQGLHVVAPIVPAKDWSACILFDYLRNNRTNTSVCAYSPRATPDATVSVPLDWSELGGRRTRWTVVTVVRRRRCALSAPLSTTTSCGLARSSG